MFLFQLDLKHKRFIQRSPTCTSHRTFYQIPFKDILQHGRDLPESKLIITFKIYVQNWVPWIQHIPWSVESLDCKALRYLSQRFTVKAFLPQDTVHGGRSTGDVHRVIFNCYLMLPDALILLFVVTGTRFPLVPLVVLAAEAFTTM